MRRILVVHAVPNLQRQAGGIAGVVPPLCEALKAASIESIVLTFAVDPDQRIRGQVSSEMEPTAVMLEHSINSWSVAETIASEVSELRFSHPEIVLHNHGLWHPLNHALALVARRLRRPMITSLHGALLPWARAHKRSKKTIAWWLYQARDLTLAAKVHVTSEYEREQFLATGLSTPTSVIKFGVDLGNVVASPAKEGPKRLIFLGRVHPIKGLMNLLKAWSEVRPAGWRAVIAGPDELGHTAELRAEVLKLGILDSVEFVGPAYGRAKGELISSAAALVLPSFSENFGTVVVEALASGVPVIASTGTPWQELETERCGWWVTPDAEGIASALRQLIGTAPAELTRMGHRGRQLVERQYTWHRCAALMAQEYRSMCYPIGD